MKKGEPAGGEYRIQGHRVRRLHLYQYWYQWNGQGFDIREVRAVLGLKTERARDFHSGTKACAAYLRNMDELRDASAGRDFAEILRAAHEREEAQHVKRIIAENNEGLPF